MTQQDSFGARQTLEVGGRHGRNAVAARHPAYRVSLWAVWCRHQRQYLRSSMRSLVLVLFLVVT